MLVLLLLLLPPAAPDYTARFTVREGEPAGARVGFIGEAGGGAGASPPRPPYLVVPVADSPIDTDLDIDQGSYFNIGVKIGLGVKQNLQ